MLSIKEMNVGNYLRDFLEMVSLAMFKKFRYWKPYFPNQATWVGMTNNLSQFLSILADEYILSCNLIT